MGTARVRKRHHIKKHSVSRAQRGHITSSTPQHEAREGSKMMAQRHGHIGNTTQCKAGQTMNEMDLLNSGKGVGVLLYLLNVMVDLWFEVTGQDLYCRFISQPSVGCDAMHDDFYIQQTFKSSDKYF